MTIIWWTWCWPEQSCEGIPQSWLPSAAWKVRTSVWCTWDDHDDVPEKRSCCWTEWWQRRRLGLNATKRMTLMRMRKGRTDMSPGISFTARVIVMMMMTKGMMTIKILKRRTNMSPGISFSARVIVFLPQSAREMSATLYGTWPKKGQWEIFVEFFDPLVSFTIS